MPRFLITLAAIFALTTPLPAHESRPAYLELRETSESTFDVLWKVPARSPNERLALDVRFPSDAQIVTATQRIFTGGAFVDRLTIRREGGIANMEIYIEGLSNTLTDALLRVAHLDGTVQTHRLSPSSPSIILPEEPTSSAVAKTYTVLGIQHILEGVDHLLFVLCLIIVAGINRKLLLTITGFTLAHSITLALAALGIVHIPVPPVEAVIALSIVFLATEIARGNKQGLTYRYPVAVSMSFGLLHGFGFAAVLSEIGLPRTEIPTALLFFNLGVELGQLLFIAATVLAFTVFRFLAKRAPSLPTTLTELTPKLAAYTIGSVAAYWTIERIAGF